MDRCILHVPALAACLAVAACSAVVPSESDSDPTGIGGKADVGQTGETLRLLTYNAGLLTGIVGLAAERRDPLVRALAESTADVLCLEEVWADEDAQRIRQSLAADYPYSFQEKTGDRSFGLLECNLFSLLGIKSCVDSRCVPQGLSAFECIGEGGPCQDKFDPVSLTCKHCLAANPASPVACAFLGAKKFGNGGRNGLLLLSRYPLENVRYMPFETQLVRRGVITADVRGVRVECTHMTADLESLPYKPDGRFSSWAEEHSAQIDTLAEVASPSGCTVLLGDLNAGPAGPAFAPELAANYGMLLDYGFIDGWSEPTCTYCSENPLVGGSRSVWIDHLLTRGCDAPRGFARVFDAPIQVSFGGRQLETRLSDHYGLMMELPIDDTAQY